MRKDNPSESYVVLLGLVVGIFLGLLILKITDVERAVKAHLDYLVQYDLCVQEAVSYGLICQVERDADGTYNWYYNPAEHSVNFEEMEI